MDANPVCSLPSTELSTLQNNSSLICAFIESELWYQKHTERQKKLSSHLALSCRTCIYTQRHFHTDKHSSKLFVG